jgi:hydroxymethylbilane synthase
MTLLRIGTRASALALVQTGVVAAELARATGSETQIVEITTEGDRSTASLSELGGTGVFASALREALLAGECDVVVHSLKDLPTASHPGLVIGAVPERADARDALCARDGLALDALPSGSRVGTGSPRRAAQVRSRRSDLEVVDVRGNVDTRLAKVARGDLDAVILAAAGLGRLGRSDAVSEYFDLDDWPTAPGQGALAIEVREGEGHLVRALEHAPTRMVVDAERHLLALLEAGCSAPVGAHAFTGGGRLSLVAQVYSTDGARTLTASHEVMAAPTADSASAVARHVADELLDAGAADLTGGTP